MIATALLGLSLAGLPCHSPLTSRCTCVQSLSAVVDTLGTAREALMYSTAIFTGRVINTAVRRDSVALVPPVGGRSWWRRHLIVATVVVQTRLKGTLSDTVQVETDIDPASCGADLALDGEYLIDARSGPSNTLYTQHCGFTRPLSESGRLIELLERARAP